jgi:bifunctional UDP-N-acetylglucosamine pyrophosphorylase/glucosamine-1-phosphate N-acetyltransferase
MRSSIPKVLHAIAGRSLLAHSVLAARALDPEHLCVVVGHARERVTAHLRELDPAAVPAVQAEQLGTGHALRQGLAALPPLTGTVVVIAGDTPLLTATTLSALVSAHEEQGNAATVLTSQVPDPTGYGRVLRDGDGAVRGIVEERDAAPEERAVTEINSGMYAFDADRLHAALARVQRGNSQGEEYLTDVIGILRGHGHRVGAVAAADHREVLGVNDRVQLAQAGALLTERLLDAAMRAGVTIIDPRSTWIDVDVQLEADVVLHPGTRLYGRTRVAAGAEIGPDCTLTDTVVGPGAHVASTTATEAEIGAEAAVGPYTYLRPGTRLGRGAKAGGFVEIKASVVGDGSKVPHLSYVGDAEIGVGTNVGAATVVVNYDGVAKHRTRIGDHVRIGSDSMLIAPLTIGDGAYTAAGSSITEDVPPGALAIARPTQRNIEGWVERRRPGSPAAAAAAAAQRTDGVPAVPSDGVAPADSASDSAGAASGKE